MTVLEVPQPPAFAQNVSTIGDLPIVPQDDLWLLSEEQVRDSRISVMTDTTTRLKDRPKNLDQYRIQWFTSKTVQATHATGLVLLMGKKTR